MDSSELCDAILAILAFSITFSSLLNIKPTSEFHIIAPFPIMFPILSPVANFISEEKDGGLKYGSKLGLYFEYFPCNTLNIFRNLYRAKLHL